MQKIKVLVTGGTGFIGSHLVRRLIKDNYESHLIVRPASNLTLIKNIREHFQLHIHDGTMERMIQIIDKSEPKLVFHLASLFLAHHNTADVSRLIQSNLLFATQLLEALAIKGVHYFINTGTSWQHFQNEKYNPVCLYAATKQAFEAILKFYTEAINLKAITLKLYDTYGTDDPRPKLFTLLRRAMVEQSELAMSPGEQLIDLVYIDDIIEGYILAAKRVLAGKVSKIEEYALCSGNPITLKKLTAIYSQTIKKSLPIKWGARCYRPREVMITWNKGKKLPGWNPKIGLIEGIKRMENIND